MENKTDRIQPEVTLDQSSLQYKKTFGAGCYHVA